MHIRNSAHDMYNSLFNQVPIWMQQSPEDTSFTFTPINYGNASSRVTNSENTMTKSIYPDNQHADYVPQLRAFNRKPVYSFKEEFSLNIDRPPHAYSTKVESGIRSFNGQVSRNTSRTENHPREAAHYEHNAFQTAPSHNRPMAYHDNTQRPALSRVDNNQDYIQSSGPNPNQTAQSKWGKFNAHQHNTVPTTKTNSHHRFHGNVQQKQTTTGSKKGVDHLVPVSPVNQTTTMQLLSDTSASASPLLGGVASQESSCYGELFESPDVPMITSYHRNGNNHTASGANVVKIVKCF